MLALAVVSTPLQVAMLLQTHGDLLEGTTDLVGLQTRQLLS